MSDLRRAVALYDSKQYAAALPLFHSALRRSEKKAGGPSSPETASILDKIGYCYELQCYFRAAAEHYRRAAASTSYDFIGRIQASINAASSFLNSSYFAEVETQTNLSLAMLAAEAAAGTTVPALLKRYRAMALDYSSLSLKKSGRYSETLPHYEENLSYYESIGDTVHLSMCLSGLGGVYVQQGLPEKALAMARRVQCLNPSTAESIEQLGKLLSDLNLHEEAHKCYYKILEHVERDEGKNSLRYAIAMSQIGNIHIDLRNPIIALAWLHRARVTFEKFEETNSERFGILLLNIGVAHEQLGNVSEALAHFTRSETIFRAYFPPDHSIINHCMRNIAAVNTELGNVDAAATAAAAVAATASRSQVQCAAAGCPRKLKADGTPLDQCSGCKRCYYCSKACQTADWKAGHKTECKELRSGK